MSREIFLFDLGLVEYEKVYALQKKIAHLVAEERFPQTLLLLEHLPVYTTGLSGSEESVGFPVLKVDRGGDITFHGPGQLIGYPILYVRDRKVSRYIKTLEESLIFLLKAYSITGTIKKGYPGVWTGEEKIASIGVRVQEGVTYHGFALNVNVDLKAFECINPCGLNVIMTSMEKLLSRRISMEKVKTDYMKAFEEKFNLVLSPKDVSILEGMY